MLLLIRIFGVWFLLLAMVAAVVDATKSLGAGGRFVATPMADEWSALSPNSLAVTKQAVESHLGHIAWPFIATVLQAPSWLIFGVIGVGLYLLGRKRKPAEIFIN